MNFSPRRVIALLLLAVTFCGLLTSFSENVVCAGELPGAHEKAMSSCDHDGAPAHDGDTTGDHICLDDCDCPCNAPLPSPLIAVFAARPHTRLATGESSPYLPEVYLSLFVPPDISA